MLPRDKDLCTARRGNALAACGVTDISLQVAASQGRLATVQCLLASGANVHSEGDLALRWAAEGGHLEVVRCLLEAGADVRVAADLPLQVAARSGYANVVECLLNAGADVHALGDLALRWAVERGHFAVACCLLDAGADVHAKAGNPLRLAITNQHWTTAQALLYAGAMIPEDVSVEAQVRILSAETDLRLSVSALALQGGCQEALVTLLSRQGQAALAAILQATQLLAFLAPAERAARLAEMLG